MVSSLASQDALTAREGDPTLVQFPNYGPRVRNSGNPANRQPQSGLRTHGVASCPDPSPPRRPHTSTSSSRAGESALQAFAGATQEQVDRLCQAVAWAVANESDVHAPCLMGVEESGIGDPESRVGKRFKVMGILRDVLRQKSIGVIEELPEKGHRRSTPSRSASSHRWCRRRTRSSRHPVSASSPSSAATPSSSPRTRAARTRRARPSRSCAARWRERERPSISSNASTAPASRPPST